MFIHYCHYIQFHSFIIVQPVQCFIESSSSYESGRPALGFAPWATTPLGASRYGLKVGNCLVDYRSAASLNNVLVLHGSIWGSRS